MQEFKVKDTVVCPYNGAGVIVDIKKKKVLGETNEYLIMDFKYGGKLRIELPVEQTKNRRIRKVCGKTTFNSAMKILSDETLSVSGNWKERCATHKEWLDEGKTIKVAEVVRNLMIIDSARSLSASEKNMLSNAKKVLASEMAELKGIKYEDAIEKIETAVHNTMTRAKK